MCASTAVGPCAQLSRQHRLEAEAAKRLAGAREELDAAVLRQRSGHRSVGEDDDLVDTRRASAAIIGTVAAERRMARVDLLRDEDDAASRVLDERLHPALAYSAGVASHGLDARPRLGREPLEQARGR